ncbi:MAG TPA: hypothetical protein VEQ11_01675 [Chloroflexota bacterium]|nr:hypothetical protein [Chloroflexota bacterium]
MYELDGTDRSVPNRRQPLGDYLEAWYATRQPLVAPRARPSYCRAIAYAEKGVDHHLVRESALVKGSEGKRPMREAFGSRPDPI